MEMSYDEIVMRYKQAKDRNEQIGILADLNDCGTAEILKVLTERGAIAGVKPPKKEEKVKKKLDEGALQKIDSDIIRWHGEGISGHLIAERIGMSVSWVYARMRKLTESGQILKEGKMRNTAVSDNKVPKAAAEETETGNAVKHPKHYTVGRIECIEYIKDKLSDDEFKGYIKGNVIKYLTREAHKNKREDLEKALWYLNFYLNGAGEK